MPHPCRSLLLLAALLLAAVAASSCAKSSTGSGATTSTSRTTFASIAELQKGLQGKGIACELEYEGLRQEDKTLSLCLIDGTQATLTIWDKPEVLDKFLASDLAGKGATAVGANWTVDVDSPVVATKVATALGGQVKSAGPTTSGRL